jgi:hypothetical protein
MKAAMPYRRNHWCMEACVSSGLSAHASCLPCKIAYF